MEILVRLDKEKGAWSRAIVAVKADTFEKVVVLALDRAQVKYKMTIDKSRQTHHCDPIIDDK